MARWLLILGLVLVATGMLWPWLAKLGIGRLPGDLLLERGSLRVYLPITTTLLISLLLSLLLWLLNR